MPANIVKSNGRDSDSKRWVQGIASTDATDLQGEVVLQKGIDTEYFLSHGFFNYDHRPGAEFKIGEPTECKLTAKGLWVKGFLYEGKKAADDMWEHFTSLSKSGSKRKVGFSIEGRVLRKSGNVIEKCWLQDIAVTPSPVNVTTWAEVAKSLSAQTWDRTKQVAPSSLTFGETVDLIKSTEGVTEEDATTLASLIFQSI